MQAAEDRSLQASPSQKAEWSWIQPIQWDSRDLRRRGGWLDEGSSQPAGTLANIPSKAADYQAVAGPTSSGAQPNMRFRSAPVGFPQLRGEDSWWDDWGCKSQLQEIRDMMGEGPMFSSIEPSEIQRGDCLPSAFLITMRTVCKNDCIGCTSSQCQH